MYVLGLFRRVFIDWVRGCNVIHEVGINEDKNYGNAEFMKPPCGARWQPLSLFPKCKSSARFDKPICIPATQFFIKNPSSAAGLAH